MTQTTEVKMTDKPQTPEQRGDELLAEGEVREAAEEYAKALKPFQGFAHLTRIAQKQTAAMRELFRREPR